MVRKTRKKTATKLYKSAYTIASVTSFGTCSSTRNWSSKKQPISTIVQAFTCPESKVRISSGFTSGNNRLSGQKKRIIAVSSEPVSTQFLQPITIRIGDYSYLYIQYGKSITLHHTIPVCMILIIFCPVSFLCLSSYKYRGFQTFAIYVNYLESLRMLFQPISFFFYSCAFGSFC